MRYIILVILAASFLSCSNKPFFKEAVEVEEKGWDLKEVLDFNFTIEDETQDYTLILNLKHLKSYAYNNVFFFVDVIDPNKKVLRDTIQCFLSSPTGKILGDVSGDHVALKLIYNPKVNFPVKGAYQIKIQHAMRDTLLKRINSVGIELKEFDEFK